MNEVQKIETHRFSTLSDEKIALLKKTVCKDASNDELELFLHVCNKTGLDPFIRQIYSVPRGKSRTIQMGIDGFRLIAERTGKYSPGKESTYVYNDKGVLISATSYIKKMTSDGTWHEIAASAMYTEYCPGNNSFWGKMPHVMLSKCAEAAALRKGFPSEMAGLYVKEEMDQADYELEADSSLKEEEEEPKLTKEEAKIINDYLSSWGKDANHFYKWMREAMHKAKWATELEAVDMFKQHAEYTKKTFEEWLAKKKSEANDKQDILVNATKA